MQNARAGWAGAGANFEEWLDSRSLRLGRAPLDRGRLAVAVAVPRNLDPPRLALLGLRDRHLENAVMEPGTDLVRVDPVGEREGAGELAERALEAEEALLLALVLGLPLTADGQRPIVEFDRHIVLLHAGQISLEQVVLVGLDEVHLGNPALRDGRLLPERIQEPVEFGREGLRSNNKAHNGYLHTPKFRKRGPSPVSK